MLLISITIRRIRGATKSCYRDISTTMTKISTPHHIYTLSSKIDDGLKILEIIDHVDADDNDDESRTITKLYP